MASCLISLDTKVLKEFCFFRLHALSNCSPAFRSQTGEESRPQVCSLSNLKSCTTGPGCTGCGCNMRSEWRSRQRGGPITLRSLDRSQALKLHFCFEKPEPLDSGASGEIPPLCFRLMSNLASLHDGLARGDWQWRELFCLDCSMQGEKIADAADPWSTVPAR